jgi:hypothetical protein
VISLRGIILLVMASANYGAVLAQSRSFGSSDFDGVSPTELTEKIRRLETLLSSTEPSVFRVIRTSDELPYRALAMLKAVASSNLAEWGERWNAGDIITSHNEPRAQHVVSWVSSSTTATVFKTGGFGVAVNLLLTDVTVPIYCVYRLDGKDPSMSIEDLQWLLRRNRGYRAPKPECRPYDVASLRHIE